MANHIRQQIRERAGTILTGLTTTGSNVFETRIYPLSNTNLPALAIYTKNETSERHIRKITQNHGSKNTNTTRKFNSKVQNKKGQCHNTSKFHCI